jgi:hypothetical protein
MSATVPLSFDQPARPSRSHCRRSSCAPLVNEDVGSGYHGPRDSRSIAFLQSDSMSASHNGRSEIVLPLITRSSYTPSPGPTASTRDLSSTVRQRSPGCFSTCRACPSRVPRPCIGLQPSSVSSPSVWPDSSLPRVGRTTTVTSHDAERPERPLARHDERIVCNPRQLTERGTLSTCRGPGRGALPVGARSAVIEDHRSSPIRSPQTSWP